ncbi:MAG TPA: mechanosensitive ion channel domain-containing protein [Candidatus Udaeobacter sp.]|nr:mechanosensitive ion channel domain-containing protein [Candidatus Udaeobacter sp.]
MILAAIGGWSIPVADPVLLFVVGLVVLAVFLVASRLIARFAGEELVKRHVRPETVALTRRIVTFVVIGLGIFAALAFAFESANVALAGLVLATILAALGVQDLLKDYVSGYYMLLERHIRAGDRIEFDGHQGTVLDVRLRVTMLKSEHGDQIIVPNSELFTKPVTILTSPPDDARTAPPA